MDYASLKTVYFVRHGQSVDNVSPVFQAATAPLSDTGQRQASTVASRFDTVSFEALVASPVLRARQTAEAIHAATGVAIEFSDLFVERVKPSSVEGKSWDDPEAAQKYADWQATLRSHGARVEDGENFTDVITRVDAAFAYLQGRNEQSLVVVTHGHFLSAMVARALMGSALTPEAMWHLQHHADIENTSITVMKYANAYSETQPSWRLWAFNDHAHFAE